MAGAQFFAGVRCWQGNGSVTRKIARRHAAREGNRAMLSYVELVGRVRSSYVELPSVKREA